LKFDLWESAKEHRLIVAHRGTAGGNIPCNTYASYEIALMQGADMIETDVDCTKDGVLVIFHPGMEKNHLFRNDIRIPDLTYDEVKQLRFVNCDNTLTQFGIMSFEELLERFKGRCYINVDKFWGNPEAIYRAIKRHGMEKQVLESLLGRKFYVICGDKEAMKQLLEELPPELANKIDLTVTDRAGEAWNEQRSLARERMGARMIVTVTVVAVCAVMLWLLQRSRVRAHSGMIAVYRLLCIPKRKLVSLFFWEAFLSSLTSALPATVLAFFAMRGASMVAELNYSVYLPMAAAAITYGCILLFHLAASVLPVLSLVRIPPAQLAAKYDF